MWTCKSCGEENDETRDFCYVCSARKRREPYGSGEAASLGEDQPTKDADTESLPHRQRDDKCLHCGENTSLGDQFCGYCGIWFVQLIEIDDAQPVTKNERMNPPGYLCFLPSQAMTCLFEAPDSNAAVLFVLGKGEPVPIVAEARGGFWEVLLPGGLHGFVNRNTGLRREVAVGNVQNPLGYYRINTELETGEWGLLNPKKVKEVDVRMFPKPDAESIVTLQAWHCVPIVEAREDWYKIQLDDGIRGFVPKKMGVRTLRKESLPLPESPDEKRGSSVLGGIASVIGLLALGTLVAGVKEGMKDFD